MADKTTPERIAATDIGSAIKAKVDKLKEAQTQVDAQKKELDVERRKLDADKRELAKMEQALEALKEDLDRRDDELSRREGELGKDRKSLHDLQEKLAGEDNRLKEWSKALQNTEQQIESLQDKAKSERDEVGARLAEANAKIVSLVEREELVASREAALADSLERVTKIGESIAGREKTIAAQQEDFIRLQNERVASLQRREEETSALMETFNKRMKEQEGQFTNLSTMEQTLKSELEKLAKERARLVVKERNILEVERSLASALEATGIEWEPAGEAPAKASPPPPPRAAGERPPAPEPARGAPPPPPPKQKETLEQEFEKVVAGSGKATKADAIDRMNRALEIAKRARDAGHDVTEVRRILKAARTAFEGQDWEEAVRLSDQILERLEPSPAASR